MTLAFAPPDSALTALTVEPITELPCRQYDADLWFADAPADLEVAKALCGGCPLKVECLAGALERGEPWGVWGGEIFERGAIVARKRPRGRPRKDELAREAVLRHEVATRISLLTSGELRIS
ncbi:MAG TPA: WhiB family transcriptional regulator [Micromonosporaceae bacterium]|jgi:WhiB family redox-sensing transcriptional regulator